MRRLTRLSFIEGLALCSFLSLVIWLLAAFVSEWFLLLSVPGTIFAGWLGFNHD